MCGRTACTLDPDDIRCACAYTNRKGQRKQPKYRPNPSKNKDGGSSNNEISSPNGKTYLDSSMSNVQQTKIKKYYPSTNISPQSVTPVLVSSKHFEDDVDGDDHLLTLMQWGLVPSWHKGDPSKVAYKMNNCRSEGMMTKSMYKRPFEKGRRCVVLADGYYEWKTDKNSKAKQPFFIYMPQTNGNRLSKLHTRTSDETFDSEVVKQSESFSGEEVKQCEEDEEDEECKEWTGHRLLAMAGIYDCWISPTDGESLYTYSIITIESTSSMADIHHRMPVILKNEDAIRDWLDYSTVPAKEALKLVKSENCLQFHPVSSQVNNSRYKGLDCVTPIELGKPPQSKGSNLMTSWLKKATNTPTKKESDVSLKAAVKEEQIRLPVKRKKNMMEEWIEKGKSPQKKAAFGSDRMHRQVKDEASKS